MTLHLHVLDLPVPSSACFLTVNLISDQRLSLNVFRQCECHCGPDSPHRTPHAQSACPRAEKTILWCFEHFATVPLTDLGIPHIDCNLGDKKIVILSNLAGLPPTSHFRRVALDSLPQALLGTHIWATSFVTSLAAVGYTLSLHLDESQGINPPFVWCLRACFHHFPQQELF